MKKPVIACEHCGATFTIGDIKKAAMFKQFHSEKKCKSCKTCGVFVCDNFADKSCWRPKK